VELADAEDWIRTYIEPVSPIRAEHQRPWATVLRVPIAEGVAWFKACGPASRARLGRFVDLAPVRVAVVTFRFLEEVTKLHPDDPWFARLRDAYLEPWGRGLEGVFALAMRVGIFAHAIAWLRQRDHVAPKGRAEFDSVFPIVLRRAIARTTSPPR
jgi:hypothetical protein